VNQNQYDDFVDRLNAISDAVGSRRLTDMAISVYWQTLRDFELADISKALTQHMRNPDIGQFMPKPADIIRQIEGSGDERSLVAWTKLERAVTQVGPWKPIVFDDARIHVVIEEMGGLAVFNRATMDEWNILRSWFMKSYRATIQRPVGAYTALLWADGGNRAQMVFIGDEAKARQVLVGGGEAVAITHASKSVAIGELIKPAAAKLASAAMGCVSDGP